ncbi:MAG TPA: fibrobacter succinogenes major paralogous domain-containing protein [Paludibacteraceae bacterium]|nr:fibrobacter succinogenes major paralogous domain-containing protein [Paludibacteraceae bacterium]
MKKLISILLVVFTTVIIKATVPQNMSYQAVVRNSNNNLVTNTNIGMQVSILHGSATGIAVYVESHYPTTNANGLVSIQIGMGTAISGTFSTIDWSSGPYFIKCEYDFNGGANYTTSGTSQILSVPFAIYADKAGNGFSGNFSDLKSTPTSLSGYGITDAVNTVGEQTVNGTKTFTSNIKVVTPVTSNDAANKLYVDAQNNKICINGNNISVSYVIPDSVDCYTTFDGGYNYKVFLPIPTSSNKYLNFRIGTTLVLRCNSSLSFDVMTSNTNLMKPLNLSKGSTAIFLFDGNIWKKMIEDDMATFSTQQLQDQVIKLQNTILAGGYMVDIDGNRYNTVKIGDQVWMAENLKTTRYNDGTKIPVVPDSTNWMNLTTGARCYYNNDSTTYNSTYGPLYNWYAVNTEKLAPTGWHVPTDEEWTTLTTYLGGLNVAGGKLKEKTYTHWSSPNTGATNETGFTAIPGGNRDKDNNFVGIGLFSAFWSSTIYPQQTAAWGRVIFWNSTTVNPNNSSNRLEGKSIRCVKD